MNANKQIAAMQETDSDERFVVRPEILIDARSMIVDVAGRRLEGEAARKFLETVLAPPDFARVERIARAFEEKWSPVPKVGE